MKNVQKGTRKENVTGAKKKKPNSRDCFLVGQDWRE